MIEDTRRLFEVATSNPLASVATIFLSAALMTFWLAGDDDVGQGDGGGQIAKTTIEHLIDQNNKKDVEIAQLREKLDALESVIAEM